MIMSHDAGTGYGMENFAISFLTQTQSGSFAQQLDCGVRAFDVRPFMKTKMTFGKSTPCSVNKCGLKMHHGDQVTTASLDDAFRDVLAWTATHQDEFVLLLLNSFGTDDSAKWSWEKIWDEIVKLLKSMDIYLLPQENLAGLTVAKAYADSYRSKHGRVVAMYINNNGRQSNYDSSITCYGNPANKCYTDAQNWWNKPQYDQRWDNYMNGITKPASYPSNGKLMQQQAHWQQDTASYVGITTSFSSTISDTRKSNINAITAQRIDSGAYPKVSLVELDDVCHNNGAAMYDAIRRYQIKVMGSMANGQTHLHHRHTPHSHHRHFWGRRRLLASQKKLPRK